MRQWPQTFRKREHLSIADGYLPKLPSGLLPIPNEGLQWLALFPLTRFSFRGTQSAVARKTTFRPDQAPRGSTKCGPPEGIVVRALSTWERVT